MPDISASVNRFRLLHSEIIQHYQCIENDMRRLYSAMTGENYDEVMAELSDKNWCVILGKLKKED